MDEAMKIENPGKVIDILTARVSQLERSLEFQIEENRRARRAQNADLVRWLRMRAVIPLYVGHRDADAIRKEFVGNELISDQTAAEAFEQVWYLDRAPVPKEAIDALRNAANNGMSRFCSHAAEASTTA